MIDIKPGVYYIPILEDWMDFYKQLKPNASNRAILLAESKWRVYGESFCVDVLDGTYNGGYGFIAGSMYWYSGSNRKITTYISNDYEVELL